MKKCIHIPFLITNKSTKRGIIFNPHTQQYCNKLNSENGLTVFFTCLFGPIKLEYGQRGRGIDKIDQPTNQQLSMTK